MISNSTVTDFTTSSMSLTGSVPERDVGTGNLQEAFINITNLTAGTQYTFTITAVGVDNSTNGAAVHKVQFTRMSL